MGWFKRIQDGITTKSTEKKEIPEGAWHQCVNCKTVVTSQQHADRIHVCNYCGHHDRVGSEEYFELLFDDGKYREVAPKIESGDPLKFIDTKSYSSRLDAAKKKTGLADALRTASGDLEGIPVVISCMDFQFIGGSMGSVVGEKIARGIDLALKKGCPFICISKSGGARMMEAGLSLMQMAKTSAKLSLLAKGRASLYFGIDGSHNGRGDSVIRYAGRYEYCGTQCLDWIRWAAGSERNHWQGSSRRGFSVPSFYWNMDSWTLS